MALAKYYEDILKRLEEDRNNILKKLRLSQFRRASDENNSLADHIEKHLLAAQKAYDEFLDLLTNQKHQPLIDSLTLESEKSRGRNLESELEKARESARNSQSIATRMKDERNEYKKENESIKIKNEKLKNEIKNLNHEIKNLKRGK